ncbi:MAG: TIGR00296 family protein [Acidilobaceae archaeon]
MSYSEETLKVEEVDLELARLLVGVAREAIRFYLEKSFRLYEVPRELLERQPLLRKKAAVFVTLEKIAEVGGKRVPELRGCIGFVEPVYPLHVAIVESAVSSAFGDPRFPPVKLSELGEIVIVLTILGEKIPVSSLDEVVIGRDGLYVEMKASGRRLFAGVLLPEVPVEYCWDIQTFADMTCRKAGLEPGCWKDPLTTLYRIPGRTFRELEPGGEVVEADLVKEYRERCTGGF